jgi:hypothetical protein
MKKTNNYVVVILLLVLLTISRTQAQNVTLKMGPTIETKMSSINLAGIKDNELYALQFKREMFSFKSKPEIFLERYDNAFNKKKSSQLVMPNNKKNNDILLEDIEVINDKFYIFSSFYNKSTDLNYLFVNSINDAGTVENDYIELDQIPSKSKKKSGRYDLRYSNDSTKILILTHSTPKSKKDNESYKCKVFDNNFKLLWEKTFNLDVKDDKFSFDAYTVDNNGKVYVLGIQKLKQSERIKSESTNKRPKYRYTIYSYDPSNSEQREFIVDGDKFLLSSIMRVNKDGNLIFASSYANTSNTGAQGILNLIIDGKTNNLLHKSMEEISDEVNAITYRKKKAKKDKGIYALVMKEIIFKENGGYVLITEQEYIIVRTTRSSNGVTTTTYHYYNNDLILFSYDDKSKINWVSLVPKRQHTVNDGGFYNSYSSMVKDDKIYLFYNDEKRNEKIVDYKKRKVMTRPKNATLCYTSVDINGEMKYKPVFNNKKESIIIPPEKCRQYKSGTMNVIAYPTDKLNISFFGAGNVSYKIGEISIIE